MVIILIGERIFVFELLYIVTGKSLSLPNGFKIWRVLRRLLRLITVYLTKEEAINSKTKELIPFSS